MTVLRSPSGRADSEIWGHVWTVRPDPETIGHIYRCQYCGEMTREPFSGAFGKCPVDTQKARELVLAVTRP